MGLDDWKFALPLGVIVGAGAVANEVIILDTAFQMGCISFLSFATLYTQLGGALGQTLDEYSEGIRKAVTEVDVESAAEMNESIRANQRLIEIEHDIAALQSLSDDLAVAQADVLNQMNQHAFREAVAKKLDSLVAIEEAAVMSIRSRMVKKVKEDVLSAFGEKKAKEAALAQAISVLSAGLNSKLGKDVVGEEFSAAIKSYKSEYAKQPKGSDEILVQLEKDMNAVSTAPVVDAASVYSENFLLGNTIKLA